MTIDLSSAPRSVLLDSSVLTEIRPAAEGPSAEVAKALWAELHKNGHRILVPAVVLAEYVSNPPHLPPKRDRNVSIAAFDDQAAMILGQQVGPSAWVNAPHLSATKKVAKYDAMIVATAIRHKAELVITTDDWMIALCVKLNLQAKRPTDFPYQLSLPAIASGN